MTLGVVFWRKRYLRARDADMHSGRRHSSYRRPRSVADVTRENVQAMRRLEELAVAKRTLADRVAEFVARFCGSITFVWIHVRAVLGLDRVERAAGPRAFDPYPFTFLTLCVSLEAIFLRPSS